MKLSHDDASYRARGLIRRYYRQDPGMPEDEVPRHVKSGKNKKRKKHVHEYVEGSEIVVERRYSYKEHGFVPVTRHGLVCKGCGHKRRGYYW